MFGFLFLCVCAVLKPYVCYFLWIVRLCHLQFFYTWFIFIYLLAGYLYIDTILLLTKCSWCEVCIYWLYTSNFHFYRFMSRLYWLLIILNIHLNMYNYPLLVYRFSSIYVWVYFLCSSNPSLLCLLPSILTFSFLFGKDKHLFSS